MIYKWKVGAHHVPDLSPQIVGEELERLRTWNNGRLAPADVVAASKDKGAPLHSCFEWNDKRAAEAHRIDQAGDLIRAVDVVIERPSGDAKPIRAFVSVTRDEDRSYTSIAHALSDSELRAQVVAAAWAELVAWRKRHAELVELAEIFAVIEARAA